MRASVKIIAVGLALMAGVAVAQDKPEASNPAVKARIDLMKQQGGAVGTLGGMAKGEVPFDAAAAEAAKATLIETSTQIATVFEPQETDPVSTAKPEIWTSWDDFTAKAQTLNAAATALDVSSAETIGAGMQALGGACGGCHETYRIPQD